MPQWFEIANNGISLLSSQSPDHAAMIGSLGDQYPADVVGRIMFRHLR
jgi:hypothetical protein